MEATVGHWGGTGLQSCRLAGLFVQWPLVLPPPRMHRTGRGCRPGRGGSPPGVCALVFAESLCSACLSHQTQDGLTSVILQKASAMVAGGVHIVSQSCLWSCIPKTVSVAGVTVGCLLYQYPSSGAGDVLCLLAGAGLEGSLGGPMQS